MTYMKPQTKLHTEKAGPPGVQASRPLPHPQHRGTDLGGGGKSCPPALCSDVTGNRSEASSKCRLTDLEPTPRRAGWGPQSVTAAGQMGRKFRVCSSHTGSAHILRLTSEGSEGHMHCESSASHPGFSRWEERKSSFDPMVSWLCYFLIAS